MTTEAAAQQYLADHLETCKGRGWAVYNPEAKEVSTLPVIYGFSNGGDSGFLSAVLMAEDGTGLGGHMCSNEGYMETDLGVVEGSRPDRHLDFKKHYPGGYRMEFVRGSEVLGHAKLMEAYRLNQLQGG